MLCHPPPAVDHHLFLSQHSNMTRRTNPAASNRSRSSQTPADPPAYNTHTTSSDMSQPPPAYGERTLQLQPPQAQLPTQAHSILRFGLLCALILTLVFAFVTSLAVTYPSIFSHHSLFHSHRGGFDLPISHAVLAIQVIHLSLVALKSTPGPSFPFTAASRAISLTKFSVIFQLAIILLIHHLHLQESGLTILSGLLLLFLLNIAPNALLLATETTSQSNPLIQIRPKPSSYPANCYITFLSFHSLLLTASVLFKAQEPHLASDQLHNVHIRLGSSFHVTSTALQLRCSSIHHPPRPSAIRTILYFSPSGQTASESSQWISSLSSFGFSPSNTVLLRLCVFERPGYGHSFNLPLSCISDGVTVLEAVLEKMGEFKKLTLHQNSGFVLVGNGYGA